ncbi:hypothetical protein SAMN05216561_11291 [Nocardioides psychrotolerans]|uniref:Uncharacterized protein n=1 Tax=Nocardioides psychrotolerans TaxID=1005945 RepID=A0A1I3KMY6_9ACTN|nr:hypothetical protein SAMN05216561_11291 [Nocardioides psychrotolerans]
MARRESSSCAAGSGIGSSRPAQRDGEAVDCCDQQVEVACFRPVVEGDVEEGAVLAACPPQGVAQRLLVALQLAPPQPGADVGQLIWLAREESQDTVSPCALLHPGRPCPAGGEGCDGQHVLARTVVKAQRGRAQAALVGDGAHGQGRGALGGEQVVHRVGDGADPGCGVKESGHAAMSPRIGCVVPGSSTGSDGCRWKAGFVVADGAGPGVARGRGRCPSGVVKRLATSRDGRRVRTHPRFGPAPGPASGGLSPSPHPTRATDRPRTTR